MPTASPRPRAAAALRRVLAGVALAPLLGAAAAALAVAALPAAADAQRLVRGTVVDSASRDAVGGAVISVLDSAGGVRGRTIADARGAFSIAAGVGDRIHVVRIGFRPRTVAIPGPAAPVSVAMLRLPQMLDAVRVAGAATCGGARGAALDLWQQARDGLLAAIVARDARPAEVRILRVERTLTPAGDTVLTESARFTSGQSTRPLRAAREPAEFARLGYVHEDATGRSFYAPDADVLFDESFAATHCFRVVPADARHPGAVGLAFEPARERRGIVDVRGTLWLDPTGPALRELEFVYTNVESELAAARAGGRIDFRSAGNGVVIASRWSLRLPIVAAVVESRGGMAGVVLDRRAAARRSGVVAVSETGGAVVEARWADSTRLRDSLGTITGTVARADGSPAAGAVVSLVGTQRVAVGDAGGRYALTELLPGTYRVVAEDTALAGWLPPRGDTVAVALAPDAAADARLAVAIMPSPAASLCGAAPAGTMSLLGRLGGAGTARGVTIAASWLADASIRAAGSAAALLANEASYEITPDDEGRFYLCGVAPDRPVRLVATRDGLRVGDTTVVLRDATPSILTLRTVSRAARTASLAGTVRGDDGAAVIGAEVLLPELALTTRTDSAGAFRFDRLPPGHLAIAVRAIGFAPRADSAVVGERGSTTLDVALARAARLADVEITGMRTAIALRAFEERRKRGIGRFVDAAELRAHDGRPLSDVLADRVPGIRILRIGSGNYAVAGRSLAGPSGRVFQTSPDQRGQCYVDVYVDGVQVYGVEHGLDFRFDLARQDARGYAAIEFYAGGASLPAEFNRTSAGCGVLLLWTRIE